MKLDDKIAQWNKEIQAKKQMEKMNKPSSTTHNETIICECGHKNEAKSVYCAECGTKIDIIYNNTFKWIRNFTLWLLAWGIFNLIFAPTFGVLIIIASILIYIYNSMRNITILGILLAGYTVIQLILGIGYGQIQSLIFGLVNMSFVISILYMRYRLK